MKTNKWRRLVIFAPAWALVLTQAACTWVELSPEAQSVRVLSASEVAGCKKMGGATVSVKADVATIARSEKKVRSELETLARNSALNLKGNVVVPVSEIEQGRQRFDVYTCP